MSGLIWWLVAIGALVALGWLVVYFVQGAKRIGSPTNGPKIDTATHSGAALVLIDLQTDYLKAGNPSGYDADQVAAVIGQVEQALDTTAHLMIPAIGIRQEWREWGAKLVARLIANGAGLPGRPGTEIDERLRDRVDVTFTKPHGDAFSNPEFGAWLTENRIGHLIITGLDGCHCVHLTALGARNRGYDVTLLTPAILAADPDKWAGLRAGYGALGILEAEETPID